MVGVLTGCDGLHGGRELPQGEVQQLKMTSTHERGLFVVGTNALSDGGSTC